MRKYRDNYDGKESFVDEVLEPMLKDLDTCVVSAKYVCDESREVVIVTMSSEYDDSDNYEIVANVHCDSIPSLVRDVMAAMYY